MVARFTSRRNRQHGRWVHPQAHQEAPSPRHQLSPLLRDRPAGPGSLPPKTEERPSEKAQGGQALKFVFLRTPRWTANQAKWTKKTGRLGRWNGQGFVNKGGRATERIGDLPYRLALGSQP